MIRRLFTFASAVSLFLCVLVVAVWVRSDYRIDRVLIYRTHVQQGGPDEVALGAVSTGPSVIYFSWSSFPATFIELGWPGRGYAAKLLGFDVRITTVTLWQGGTWDSVFAADYYRWKMLRMAWWDTGPRSFAAGPSHSRAIAVPDWLLLCLLLILPLLRLRQFRRDSQRLRRQTEHRCPACGYDLRASKVRCPECGTPIIAQTGIPS